MLRQKDRARRHRRSPRVRAYQEFIDRVEPGLTRSARVHRFAVPPVIASAGAPAAAVTVCLPPGDPGPSTVTETALRTQTRAAAQVLRTEPAAALEAARTDWVVFAAPGDTPGPRALERLGQAALMAPDAAVITCDEDTMGPRGRQDPRVFQGPSPEAVLTAEPGTSLMCVRRDVALAAVATRPLGTAWRQDLFIRLAGPRSAGHAHVPQILCHRGPESPGPRPAARIDAARAALAEHAGPEARLELAGGGVPVVRRPLPDEPSVDVIVLFKDRPELLRRCVDTLLDQTAWPNLGVILMDNGSSDPEVAELLTGFDRDPRVRVERDDRPFNFAALNNAAARTSTSDYLVFLNNDTAVTDGDWMEIMLEEASRPEIGAVCPLLLHADGTVQHAGVAVGMNGYAGHPFQGLDPDEDTPFGRPRGGSRGWLAVTAACMMVERTKFDAVDGFDERFVVGGNDVDLCLRLTASGHRSVCVTHVSMLHDEGRSRGYYVDPGDFAESERSYGQFRTVGDPLYNPNLTLARTDCSLRGVEEDQ